MHAGRFDGARDGGGRGRSASAGRGGGRRSFGDRADDGRGGGRRSYADRAESERGRGRGGRRGGRGDYRRENVRDEPPPLSNAPPSLSPLVRKPARPSVFLGAREWNKLPLLATTVDAVRGAGFALPARVQELAGEAMLGPQPPPRASARRAKGERKDFQHTRAFAITAPAGAGKTLAFLVPMLDALARRDRETDGPPPAGRPPFALVVAPTSELCQQTHNVLKSLSAAGLKCRSVLATGGAALKTQRKSLEMGVDVVVATPGRAAALVAHGALALTDLRFYVLDEVDVLLREEGDLAPPEAPTPPEDQRRHGRGGGGPPRPPDDPLDALTSPVAEIDASADEEFYDEDDTGFEPEEERPTLDDFPALVQAIAQRAIAYAERRAGPPEDDLRVVCTTATLPPGAASRLLEWFPAIRLVKAPGLHQTQGGCEEVVIDCSGGLPVVEGSEPNEGSEPDATPRRETTRGGRSGGRGGGRIQYTPQDGLKRKGAALLGLLNSPEFAAHRRWIVFVNTVESARQVENLLKRHDKSGNTYRVLAFHAAIAPKAARNHLDAFRQEPGSAAARIALPKGLSAPARQGASRDGSYDPFAADFVAPERRKRVEDIPLVLVSTDRASRGMDMPHCDHVVLFDFPRDPSEYLRRAGRTARGKDGTGRVSVLVLGRQVPLARGVVEMSRSGTPLTAEPSGGGGGGGGGVV